MDLSPAPEVHDSCQPDWLSHTFKLPRGDYLDDLFAFTRALADEIDPRGEWTPPRRSRHFAHLTRHPAGLQFQFTPPDDPGSPRPAVSEVKTVGRSPGLASLEISGSALSALLPADRGRIYDTLIGWPGRFHCTRIDLQATRVNHKPDVLEIVHLVEAGSLWPKGFGRGQTYATRDLHGNICAAPTQYFGGRDSEIRARIYDKGAEQGADLPAVRFELQVRGDAAEAHFRRLVDRTRMQAGDHFGVMAAEDRTVKDALGQHLDLRDTSKWEGQRKPKNWAQSAPVPDWWQELLDGPPSPLRIGRKAPPDLMGSWNACIDQYGRKMALEASRRVLAEGQELGDVADALLRQFFAKTRLEDVDVLEDACPGVDRGVIQDFLRWAQQDAALIAEGHLVAE
jgi:hypothetical protein